MPARKILSMGTLAITAYRMRGRQGGNKSPSEPDPVTRPRASFSRNRAASSMGISRPPSARIVTPEAPVNEVKKAQTRAVTMAGPPRNGPKNA